MKGKKAYGNEMRRVADDLGNPVILENELPNPHLKAIFPLRRKVQKANPRRVTGKRERGNVFIDVTFPKEQH
ncbi:MAG TPA: hypothetical protein VFE02_18370 [Candidatus Acidoferrales bacterium]|jgi:hypothetical protein|nr:hypothetical protein [Candidatus Acidoferrales bacterium]